jgi:hypothetical protein
MHDVVEEFAAGILEDKDDICGSRNDLVAVGKGCELQTEANL